MRIRADSLAVTDKVSDSDRQTIEKTMREQVLETGKYPEITFNSTKIEAIKNSDTQYQANIWGDLTLHGVTHNVFIKAQLTFDYKSSTRPWRVLFEDDRLLHQASFRRRRYHHGEGHSKIQFQHLFAVTAFCARRFVLSDLMSRLI